MKTAPSGSVEGVLALLRVHCVVESVTMPVGISDMVKLLFVRFDNWGALIYEHFKERVGGTSEFVGQNTGSLSVFVQGLVLRLSLYS